MCKIHLSTTAYENKALYLNTLILNQHGKPFTEKDIISVVEPEGIDSELVYATLQTLVRKGLIIHSGSKFYVRPIYRKRTLRTVQRYDRKY